MSQNSPLAVVLGLSPTGLAIIRNLNRKGIKVIGIDRNPWAIGRFSSQVQPIILSSEGNWEENLFNELKDLKIDAEKPILFCADDSYLFFLSKYAKELKEKFKIPTSLNKDTIRLLLDKEIFYKMCIDKEIEIPVTYFPDNIEDVKSISKELEFPCILKPAMSHNWREKLKGQKMVYIDNHRDLIDQYKKLFSGNNKLLIQEIIPGPDSCIYICGISMGRNSEPLAVFTGRKIRQFPPKFGSASLAESIWIPEVAEMSIGLLKKLKFHGICGLEFKKDPRDGSYKMIEINLRPVLWYSLIEASGVDIVYSMYKELVGDQYPKQIQNNNIKWIYTVRDLISSFYYVFHKEQNIIEWLTSFKGKRAHAAYAKDDLRILLFYPFHVLHEIRQYLLGGI